MYIVYVNSSVQVNCSYRRGLVLQELTNTIAMSYIKIFLVCPSVCLCVMDVSMAATNFLVVCKSSSAFQLSRSQN